MFVGVKSSLENVFFVACLTGDDKKGILLPWEMNSFTKT